MIRPLHDTYHVSRLRHEGMRGSIILPESSQEVFSDGLVLAAGPGLDLPMQAEAGDRILTAPHDWDDYRGGEGDEGFVSDRRLLGVIRAPYFDCVEPAGSYVLVKPEPRQDLRETESGLLVASGSLAGYDRRSKALAFERLTEYLQLLESPLYREQPTNYDRYSMEEGFVDGMKPVEREPFLELLFEVRVKVGQAKMQGERAHLDPDDYRCRAPLRPAPRLCIGRLLGIGPEARTEAPLESRVSWSFEHRAVRITPGGVLHLLLPAEFLDCILPEEGAVRVEMKRAAA